MTELIALTGATGYVGGLVARELSAGGLELRLLARSPEKLPELPGATAFRASYSDGDASTAALAGVDTLFMVSAAENADRLGEHRAFVDSAVAAGVRRIVYTSFADAAPDAVFTLARDHFYTEQYIADSGIEYTFLRDNLYSDFMSALVGEDGVIRGPAGVGRAAIVARADVARTAAAIIRDPEAHSRSTYDLTGPEALTLAEVAAILTDALGRRVTYYDETLAEAYASRAKWGAPGWQNDAWVSTYTAIAAGALSAVSSDIERITGRSPRSLAELLAEG